DRARRNPNPKFQQQLIGDPFLAPSRIVRCHIASQFSKVHRNAGPTSPSRFPFPKQPKSFPVPTDQCVRLHNGQSRRPGEKPHQLPKRETIRISCAARFSLPLDIHRQLFAEEEILGSEGGRGSKTEMHERDCVNKNGEGGESENTSVAEHKGKN